ncbi:hypothetical protein Pst134EB_014867 [Puccinia striiformis f. sp. tritici]|nr:hypothetical protein Pst134EB_014867 [Puccinia striiformis f. sp. tritici]
MLEPQLKSVVGSPYMNRTSSTTLAFPHIDRNHPFRTHLANDNRSLQELGVVVDHSSSSFVFFSFCLCTQN